MAVVAKRAFIQFLLLKISPHPENLSTRAFKYSNQLFRIFIHPEYSSTALTNDIAVLVLEEPISITEMVSPVGIHTTIAIIFIIYIPIIVLLSRPVYHNLVKCLMQTLLVLLLVITIIIFIIFIKIQLDIICDGVLFNSDRIFSLLRTRQRWAWW